MKTFLTLCVLSQAVLAQVKLPTGDRAVNASDFAAKGVAYETWYYSLVMDNGAKINVTFNQSGGDLYPEISLTGIAGNAAMAREMENAQLFTRQASANYAYTWGSNVYAAQGMPGNGHRLKFQTAKDGKSFKLDAQFSQCVGGRVPNGTFQVGSSTFGQAILMPYCRVSGSLAVNGQNMNISGSAYMDHLWMNAKFTDLAQHALQFQTAKPAHSGRILATSNGSAFGYSVDVNGAAGRVAMSTQWTSAGKNVSASNAPTGRLDANFSGYHLTFNRGAEATYSPLAQVGFAKKLILKAIVGDVQIKRGQVGHPEGGQLHYNLVKK